MAHTTGQADPKTRTPLASGRMDARRGWGAGCAVAGRVRGSRLLYPPLPAARFGVSPRTSTRVGRTGSTRMRLGVTFGENLAEPGG
jgi:hypothetical protein